MTILIPVVTGYACYSTQAKSCFLICDNIGENSPKNLQTKETLFPLIATKKTAFNGNHPAITPGIDYTTIKTSIITSSETPISPYPPTAGNTHRFSGWFKL